MKTTASEMDESGIGEYGESPDNQNPIKVAMRPFAKEKACAFRAMETQ
jgi:hypothetical protein